MKYSVVRQFSNFAIDSAYSFVFKVIDFGKLLNLLFWGFVDIWAAFFSIFYNIFMYIYYLFLFMIDRGSESTASSFIGIKKSQKVSKIPSVAYEGTPSVVRTMYNKPKSVTPDTAVNPTTTTPKTVTETVKSTSSDTPAGTTPAALGSLKTSYSGKGAKKSFFKTISEFIVDFAVAVKNIIVKPFKLFSQIFAKKLQPVKENEVKNVEPTQGGSLIDQYLKEYEKKKKRW